MTALKRKICIALLVVTLFSGLSAPKSEAGVAIMTKQVIANGGFDWWLYLDYTFWLGGGIAAASLPFLILSPYALIGVVLSEDADSSNDPLAQGLMRQYPVLRENDDVARELANAVKRAIPSSGVEGTKICVQLAEEAIRTILAPAGLSELDESKITSELASPCN